MSLVFQFLLQPMNESVPQEFDENLITIRFFFRHLGSDKYMFRVRPEKCKIMVIYRHYDGLDKLYALKASQAVKYCFSFHIHINL
jgi:hypothetical protein